jgi:hypothetical protein
MDSSEKGVAIPSITLYREPGVGRIADVDLSDFPSMAPAMKTSGTSQHLAVTKKKGDWIKVIFDDSGREGWLTMPRGWDFQSWDKYLKGGEVRLLNGLRKDHYQLRTSPSSPQSAGSVTREKNLFVVEIDGSWMLVLVDFANSGWLRWKDDDGRFLISVEK